MKTNRFFLLTALFLSVMSVALVACSDDDDDGDDTLSIVGTWKYEYGNGYEGYNITTFNSNGYGTLEEHEIYKGKEEVDYEKFRYVFDSNTMTISFFFWDDDDQDYNYDETWHITSLTPNKMIIQGEIWVRIK